MKQHMKKIAAACQAFRRSEDGSSTIEIMTVLPAAMFFFAASYETGMIGLRNMMLERAVDVTVRDVRIGKIPEPDHAILKERICEQAMIIPNCMEEVKLEMMRKDIRNYVSISDQPDCIDRAEPGAPRIDFSEGGNNDLMILRVCALFDPVLPTAAIGAAVPKQSEGAYALVSTSSFVLEPYK